MKTQIIIILCILAGITKGFSQNQEPVTGTVEIVEVHPTGSIAEVLKKNISKTKEVYYTKTGNRIFVYDLKGYKGDQETIKVLPSGTTIIKNRSYNDWTLVDSKG